jgi:hypothetical protein
LSLCQEVIACTPVHLNFHEEMDLSNLQTWLRLFEFMPGQEVIACTPVHLNIHAEMHYGHLIDE